MGKKVLFAAFLLLGLFAPQAQAYDFIDTAQSGQTLRYTILPDSASVNVAKHGNITGDLVIPDSVIYNGTTYAVTTIKANGFGMCFGLTSVSIPGTVTTIGGAAFQSCMGLTSITIPNSVTTIGDNAFTLCSGLTSVSIGNSVDTIGSAAFASCDNLTTVTIPASVTFIGSGAFYCLSLDTIILLGQTPPNAHSAAFGSPTDNPYLCDSATLIVPCGAAEAYRSHPVWGLFANIEENCNGIEDVREKREDVRVYSTNGRIVVEGAYGETLQVYDLAGRQMLNVEIHNSKFKIQNGPPASTSSKSATAPRRKWW